MPPPAAQVGISKHRYLLANQLDAFTAAEPLQKEAHADIFADNHQLLADLKDIFNWLAQKPAPAKISRARFKERAPELFRQFPQIATSFGKIDVDGDGCISWEEFLDFCLKSPLLQARTRKLETITVYGRDADGQKSYKDDTDPELMCEMLSPPPLLPWEVSHTVEWRISNLQSDPRWTAPKIGQLRWAPGKHIDSPPFGAAGARGFMRFWPGGQLSVCQQRLRQNITPTAAPLDNSLQHPAGARGCCIGLVMPPGAHLIVRFFVGASRSKPREVCWSYGGNAAQVWAPVQESPPSVPEGDCLVAGVEILKNFNAPRKPRVRRVEESTRRGVKPRMRECGATGCPALGKVRSLPSLPRLLHEHVEDAPILGKSVSLPRLSVSAIRFRPGVSAEARLPMVSFSPIHA